MGGHMFRRIQMPQEMLTLLQHCSTLVVYFMQVFINFINN